MDYIKIYNRLICKAKLEKRKKGFGIYYDAHHIIPKCMGGSGDPRNTNHENIVLLTVREHYLAHWLLHRSFPKNIKLVYAFHKMSMRDKGSLIKNNRAIDEAKQAYIEALKNRIPWNKGKKFPGLTNSGSFHKGMITWNKGTLKKEETREIQRQSAKNRPVVQCPYCKKVANKSNMIQWHFDNCKSKHNID